MIIYVLFDKEVRRPFCMLSMTVLLSSMFGISWALHQRIMVFGEMIYRFGCLLMVEIIVLCLLPIPFGGLFFPLLYGIFGKVGIGLFLAARVEIRTWLGLF